MTIKRDELKKCCRKLLQHSLPSLLFPTSPLWIVNVKSTFFARRFSIVMNREMTLFSPSDSEIALYEVSIKLKKNAHTAAASCVGRTGNCPKPDFIAPFCIVSRRRILASFLPCLVLGCCSQLGCSLHSFHTLRDVMHSKFNSVQTLFLDSFRFQTGLLCHHHRAQLHSLRFLLLRSVFVFSVIFLFSTALNWYKKNLYDSSFDRKCLVALLSGVFH